MKSRRLGAAGPEVFALGMGRGSQPVRFGEPLEQEFNATMAHVLKGVGLQRKFAARAA